MGLIKDSKIFYVFCIIYGLVVLVDLSWLVFIICRVFLCLDVLV